MPYFEPGSLRVNAESTYESQPLAFGTSRQPHPSKATHVISTTRITVSGTTEGLVQFQTSPNDTTWTTIASWRNGLSAGGGVSDTIEMPSTIIVPPTFWYRVITTNVTGTPTFTFVSNYELTL